MPRSISAKGQPSPASAHRWHLEVRLEDPDEVDAELVGWLRDGYELSG